MDAITSQKAVEAAQGFNWEGAPLKRNLIEEVLNAAAPILEEKARREVEEKETKQ